MVVLCERCQTPFQSRNKLFAHLHQCGVKDDKVESLANSEDPKIISSANSTTEMEIIARDPGHYRVVCKPQGLPTMGGRDKNGVCVTSHKSLIMVDETAQLKHPFKIMRALPAHRLDSSTGGLLICSESNTAERNLKAAFRQRLVHKRYRAIVSGNIENDSGEVIIPLSGLVSHTIYRVVHRTPSYHYDTVTTVDLWPITGRRHQLRKHMQLLGHPILGDKRYSHAGLWPTSVQSLFLWSVSITFPHPCVDILSLATDAGIPTENEHSQSSAHLGQLQVRNVTVEIPEPEYYAVFRDSQIASVGK